MQLIEEPAGTHRLGRVAAMAEDHARSVVGAGVQPLGETRLQLARQVGRLAHVDGAKRQALTVRLQHEIGDERREQAMGVDPREAALLARAGLVDGAGEPVLAGAGFADQRQRLPQRGGEARLLDHAAHRRLVARQLVEPERFRMPVAQR